MASKYINIPFWEWPWELFKALLGFSVRDVQLVAMVTTEDVKKVIKGLSFLILGIIIQLVPYLVTVANDIAKMSSAKVM